MKITDGLWQVGGEGLTAHGDAAVYLLHSGNEAALIDGGTGKAHQQLVVNIAACLPPETRIRYLLLTHCHYDHTGGAAALREHYGCRIVIHEKEAHYLEKGDSAVTAASWYGAEMAPFAVDERIRSDRTRYPVGGIDVTAVHCPGHSPGSVVYTAQVAGKQVLFGQDVHGPIHPALLSDRIAYQKSLRFMLGLDADILCEGHFGIYRGKAEVRRFISAYLETR